MWNEIKKCCRKEKNRMVKKAVKNKKLFFTAI